MIGGLLGTERIIVLNLDLDLDSCTTARCFIFIQASEPDSRQTACRADVRWTVEAKHSESFDVPGLQELQHQERKQGKFRKPNLNGLIVLNTK